MNESTATMRNRSITIADVQTVYMEKYPEVRDFYSLPDKAGFVTKYINAAAREGANISRILPPR